MAAHHGRRLWVALSGECLLRENFWETTAISAPEHGVSISDLDRIGSMVAARLPSSLHCWPVAARIDDRLSWENPMGKPGRQLHLAFHRLAAKPEILDSIQAALAEAGYECAGCIAGELALTAALTPAEKEIGAAAIDLGATHTSIAVCLRGAVRYTASIRIGGENATKDLAIALGVSRSKAEDLKLALMGDARLDELADTVPTKVLTARYTEILELVRAELEKDNWTGALPGGYVLTGGGAISGCLADLARRVLGEPVRLGRPELNRLEALIARPDCTIILGLVPAIKAYGGKGSWPKGDGWWR